MPFPGFKKNVSVLLCLFLLFSDLASANSLIFSTQRSAEKTPLPQVHIPEELGMIQEIYRPAETPDAPFIFHLQTTHGSPEGARRTAEIIRYLEKQYGIKAVFAEGAGGALDRDFFKFFPDQRENQKMLELLTQKGDLTGPDLALSGSGVPFEGIEDAALYRRAFHSFRKVTANSEKTGLFIKARRLKLDAEASVAFSPQLREILDVWEKYQEGSRDMGALTDFLRAKAGEYLSVDLETPFSQFDYPQMSRLVLLKGIEKRADKNLYEPELKKLNNWLAENKIRTGFTDLLDHRVPAPRKSFEEFLKQAAPKGFRFAQYPRIHERAVSRVLESELRGPELFREMDRIFLELFQKLAKTSGETRLIEEYRRLFLLKKLLSLQLTRDEWQNVRTDLSSRYELLDPENSPEMLPLFRQALAFYRACEKRESVFFEKIFAGLKSHGGRAAVLVTGGFHASGMARIFRDRHFSYASVLPELSGDLDSSLYHAVMLGQAHLEKPEFAQPAGFADAPYYRAEMARVRDAAASLGKEISSSAKYLIDREAFAGASAARRSEMRPPEAATRVNQAMAFLSSEMPGMEVQYGFEPGRVQHLKSGGAFLASEFDSIRGGFDLLGLGENDRYFSFGSGTGRDVLAANAYGVRFAAGEEANDQLVNASLGIIFGKQGIPALAAERGLKVFDTAKISIGKRDWFKDGLLRPEARKDIGALDVFHYFIYGSPQEEQMFRILGSRMHNRAVFFLHDPWNTDEIPGMVELTEHGRRHWRSDWVKGVRILVPTESELIRLVNPGPAERLDARAAEVKKIYFSGWKYTQRLIELLVNFPAADEVMLHVPDRSASDVLRTMYGFFRGAGQGEGGIQVLGPDRWKLSFRGREWTIHFIQEPFSDFKGLPFQADAVILEEPEELGLNHRRDSWAGAYFERLQAGLRPGGLLMLQNSDRYYFPTELEWARKARIEPLGLGHLASYPEAEWRVFVSRSEMRAVDVKAAQTLLRVREKQVEAEALRSVFRNLPRDEGRSLKLLDLGGGDGELTAQAVRESDGSLFFNETVSVEKDGKRVRAFDSTRKFPGLRLIEGDFFSVTEELEKSPSKFDAILMAFSILFVPIAERDRLFRRLVRMSREDGRIIFLVNGKQRLPRNQVRAREELMTRHRVTAEDAETNFDKTFTDWGHQVEIRPIHVVFETQNRNEAIALVAGVLPSEDRDFKRIGAYADQNLYDAERKIYHFEIDEDLILVTLQTPGDKTEASSPQKHLTDFAAPLLASGHSLSFLETGGEVYYRKDGEGLQGFPAEEIAQAVRLLFQNAREIRQGALPMISVQAGTEPDDFMTAVQWIIERRPDVGSHQRVLLQTQPLDFNNALIDSLTAPESGEEIFNALTGISGASQQLVVSPVKRSEMRALPGDEERLDEEERKANEVEVRLAKLSEIYRTVFERRRLAGKKVLGHVSEAEDTGVGLFLPAREILVEKIESYMDIPEDGNIMLLDAGSGAGHFLLRFLIRNPKIKKLVGIEWNQELYEESRDALAMAEEQGLIEKGRIEFYQGDFLDARWRSYFAAADRIYYGQFGSYSQSKLGALIRDHASPSLRVVTWGISPDPFPLLVRSKKFSSRRPERNIVVYSRRSEMRSAEVPFAEIEAVVSDQITTHGRRTQGVIGAIIKYSVLGTKVSIHYHGIELPPDSFTYLYMAIAPGSRLRIRAEGPDASVAAQELKGILEDDMPTSSVRLKSPQSEMRTNLAIRRALDAETEESSSGALEVPVPEKKSGPRGMPLKISAFRLAEIPVLTPEGMPAMTPLAPGVNSFAFASAVQTFGIGDAAWAPEIRGFYREYLLYWIHASFGSALKWQNVSFSSLLARRGLSKNEPLRIFRSYQELPGADVPEIRALADFLAANRGAGLLIHAPSADPEAVRGFASRLGGKVMALRRARGESGGADVRVVSDSGALKFLKQAKYHRALVYADDASVANRMARAPAVKDRRNVLFVHNNVTADPLRQTAAFLAALDEVLTRPVLPSSVRRAGELLGEHLEMLREVRALLQASA